MAECPHPHRPTGANPEQRAPALCSRYKQLCLQRLLCFCWILYSSPFAFPGTSLLTNVTSWYRKGGRNRNIIKTQQMLQAAVHRRVKSGTKPGAIPKALSQ